MVHGMRNHVDSAKHMADMGRLTWIVYRVSSFTDVRDRRIGCDFLDLSDGVGVLLATTQEGASVGCDFHSSETLVWMYYGLGNTVKNFMVIPWSYN
jgi:hypothetical protein